MPGQRYSNRLPPRVRQLRRLDLKIGPVPFVYVGGRRLEESRQTLSGSGIPTHVVVEAIQGFSYRAVGPYARAHNVHSGVRPTLADRAPVEARERQQYYEACATQQSEERRAPPPRSLSLGCRMHPGSCEVTVAYSLVASDLTGKVMRHATKSWNSQRS